MRIYLSVDMEGLAGVAHPAQTYFEAGKLDRTDYDTSRGLMAGEANAAIGAAFAAGAGEVVVNDSHWQMRNLRAEDLDPRARLIIGDKPYSMTTGVGADLAGAFSAALFVGYHAGAGHPTGIIGHTYSSSTVLGVRVNGVAHNETALNALRLGQFGIPVALVSGDDALAGEVEELLPWAERVIVKRGLGATVTDSLSPTQAQAAIAEGVERALGRLAEMQLYTLPAPLQLEVDFRLPVMADYAAVLPSVERVSARTVAVEAPDADTMYRWVISILRLAAVPWT